MVEIASEEFVRNTMVAMINDTQIHMVRFIAGSSTLVDRNLIYGYVLRQQIASLSNNELLSFIERFDRSRFDSELNFFANIGIVHEEEGKYQLSYTARKCLPSFQRLYGELSVPTLPDPALT